MYPVKGKPEAERDMATVRFNTESITDWHSFHELCREVFVLRLTFFICTLFIVILSAQVSYAHISNFNSSFLSPDNKTALIGYDDGTIKLWDIETGKVIHTFKGHQGDVYTFMFLPDNKTFLSGGEDGTIRRWDIASGKEVWGRNWKGDRNYPLFDEYGNTVESFALSPDAKTVLAGHDNGAIEVLDIETGAAVVTLKGYPGTASSVGYSANGKMILSAALAKNIGYISLWDSATYKELKRLKDTSTLIYVAFTPDGKTILSGGNKTLRLWDVESGKLIRTINDPNFIGSIALSPDGKIALTGAAYLGHGQIKVWDVATGQIIRRLIGHSDNVVEVAFSSDSRNVLSRSDDNTAILWDISTGKIIHKFRYKDRNSD